MPALAALAPAAAGAVAAGTGPKLFPRPDIIRYDADCFTIRGRDMVVFGLEFPYPRTPEAEWPDRFAKIVAAGFNTVSTYVFWNYHERADGSFDLGELDRFLAMARRFGLLAIVRPGPYVDAEFERGGFPARVIATRAPLRGMHPVSLETSRQWYAAVVPVIARHQITRGGPVILMQIENETDFTDVPETEQREYLRYLARLAWAGGIEVPLISNVSSVVRDRSDPDMARIMDVCDFYPRWSFLTDNELPKSTVGLTMEEKVGLSDRAVLASIRKMRADQPNVPLSVAELGTGYYSKFGGKLSEDEEGADATQVNALGKTILASGVTYLSFYIGVGGSNFAWAAKGVTTPYDFAAPIREGGALWEKYDAVRGIGTLIGLFGDQIARAKPLANGGRSTHPDVLVQQRAGPRGGLLYLRANTDADHHHRLEIADPRGGPAFHVPRHGDLRLGARAMMALPVQQAVAGTVLRYATAELLGHGRSGAKRFLILHDEPGRLVELAVEAPARLPVSGESDYVEWQAVGRTLVIGARLDGAPRWLVIGDDMLVAIIPRKTALASWTGAPGAEAMPILTDACQIEDVRRDGARIAATLSYRTGTHDVAIIPPGRLAKILCDGRPLPFDQDGHTGVARFTLSVPPLPARAIVPETVEAWTDRGLEDPRTWQRVVGRPLDALAPLPYGYVRYRTTLDYTDEAFLYLYAYGTNPKRLFVNGIAVPAGSRPDAFLAVPATLWFRRGANDVEIVYEQFGSNEFGENARLTELNGMRSAVLGTRPAEHEPLTEWMVRLRPPPMSGQMIDQAFAFTDAKRVLGGDLAATGPANAPAFTWCRCAIDLPLRGAGWDLHWKLVFVADRDGILYWNGRFLGRYVAAGPQTGFRIPSSWLREDVPQSLTIILAYSAAVGGIGTLRVEPDLDATRHRQRIEIEMA